MWLPAAGEGAPGTVRAHFAAGAAGHIGLAAAAVALVSAAGSFAAAGRGQRWDRPGPAAEEEEDSGPEPRGV